AGDLVLPEALVVPAVEPALPHVDRRVETAFDVGAARNRDRLAFGAAHREQRPRALGRRERPGDCAVGALDIAGIEGVHAERETLALRDGHAAAPADGRLGPAPVEARLDGPAH